MEILFWLQNWYHSMCDGDWEHCHGVKIGTLDNPGWSFEADIIDTPLENQSFSEFRCYISDKDWIICKIKNGRFTGYGDPSKLNQIIEVFKEWVEN